MKQKLDESDAKVLVKPKRDRLGRFPKGVSGNPTGKRPGTLGPMAKVREMLVKDMVKDVRDVLKAVLKQAKDGCTTSQKMILDRVYPAIRPMEGPSSGGAETPIINIVIGEAVPQAKAKVVESEVIDV